MRVLLLIQDDEFRLVTWRLMRQAGHEVVDRPEDATSSDLAVVDVDQVPRLRSLDGQIPILALSGGSVDERVQALYDGADDCLDVPYAPSQAMARVHALARRSVRGLAASVAGDDRDDAAIRADGLDIDLDRALAIRGPTRYHLTRREVELVRYLHAARPRAVPRAELLEQVWQISPNVHTRAVDVAIAGLRKKLEIEPKSPTVIRSVVGVGYAWAA